MMIITCRNIAPYLIRNPNHIMGVTLGIVHEVFEAHLLVLPASRTGSSVSVLESLIATDLPFQDIRK